MPATGYAFDAYGTLLDVHSAMRVHAPRLGDSWTRLSADWRAKQLEYTWVRSLMGSYADFWTITEQSLDHVLAVHGHRDQVLRDDLLQSYWTLSAYSDAVPALQKLKARGHRLCVLSNGSPDMLHAVLGTAGLAELLDEVLSVDAIKVYKTAPEVYRMVTDAWDCPAREVAFISSNRWDVAGASKHGFHPIWVNRTGAPDEYPNYPPEAVISTLADLPAI